MRPPHLTALALLTAALTLGALSTPAHAATTSYVALGDSYSSGDGAGNYYSSSGGCLRSPNAFPALWAAAHSPGSFSFVACAGAKVPDVISGQLGAVTAATTLVSISIGGNDVGFSGVMQSCVLGSDSTCISAVDAAESYARATLPGSLATLFADIRSRAPAARVVVLDYPHLYDTNVWFCLGLSGTKHTVLNQGADVLDTTIGSAAAGAGFVFDDVRRQFSGHELCSGAGWLNSITLPIGESYHPTAKGQADGYLPVFSAGA